MGYNIIIYSITIFLYICVNSVLTIAVLTGFILILFPCVLILDFVQQDPVHRTWQWLLLVVQMQTLNLEFMHGI